MRAALLAFALLPCLQEAEQLVQSAMKKAEKKDLAGALADCTRAIELDPSLAQAWATRGSLRWQRGDPKSAIADLTQAVDRGSRQDSVFGLRGLCRLQLEEYPQALADFTQALQINPGRTTTRALRGLARYRLAEFRESLSDLSLAMGEGVSDSDTLIARAGAYYALESWDNALRDFRRLAASEPSLLPTTLPWIWAARARSGDPEGASEEVLKALLTHPELRTPGWNQGLIRFTLGQVQEEELLKSAEEAGDRRDEFLCDARFFAATRELVAGKEAAALESLHACLATRKKHQPASIAARAELDARHVRKNRAVLERLEARFRALKRCHADFRFRTVSAAGEDLDKEERAEFTLDFDREAGRYRVTFPQGGPEMPKGLSIYFDGMVAYAWAMDGEGQKKDFSALFDQMDRWESIALGELDRIVPAADPAPAASPREALVALVLEGKPARDQEGSFRFAIGRGGYPCSWTRDSVTRPDTTVTEGEDEITLEIPSKRKTIVIEKSSGFLRKMEARDYDGKRRILARTAFVADAPFPKIEIPKCRPSPPDAGIFQSWTENHLQVLSLRLFEAVARWDVAVQVDKTGEVRDLFRRWLVEYMTLVHQQYVKQAAGRYVQWLLNQGVRMDDLREKPDEHLKNFRTWAAQGELRKALEEHLAELGRKVATELIEEPIDSRLHRKLFSLEKQVFDFERIEEERKKGDNAALEKAFREELEAARRL